MRLSIELGFRRSLASMLLNRDAEVDVEGEPVGGGLVVRVARPGTHR